MTLPRIWPRVIAMLFGLTLLVATDTPAWAIDPYPGETREAFVARSALEQQRKLADADAAAQALGSGFAGGDTGSTAGIFKFGMFGLVALALGALRLSRGIFRASRVIAKTSGIGSGGASFEDRLAEKLRELQAAEQPPQAQAPNPADAAPMLQAAPAPPGARTFGRRTS